MNDGYQVEFDRLMRIDPAPGTIDGKRLSRLAALLDRGHLLSDPTCVEVVRFCMTENNLRQVDMVPYFGSGSRVSEFLSGKRGLSKAMIRKLSDRFGIPARLLLSEG